MGERHVWCAGEVRKGGRCMTGGRAVRTVDSKGQLGRKGRKVPVVVVETELERWYVIVEVWRGSTRWKTMGREKLMIVDG